MSDLTYRILIVDDSKLHRKQIRRFLEARTDDLETHLEVDDTDDATGAKEMVGNANPQYDLILLDWQLNNESGRSVLEWLNAQGHTIDTDVIMLTGQGSESIYEQSLELGAYAYADKAGVLIDESNSESVMLNDDRKRSREFWFHIRNCIERVHVRRRRRHVIDLLGRMHENLSQSLDYDAQLHVIVETPHKISRNIKKATLRIPSSDGNSLIRVASFGADDFRRDSKSGDTLHEDEGLSWQAFRSQSDHPIYSPQYGQSRNDYEMRWPDVKSQLAIPIFVGNETIAVLNLESDVENGFTEEVRREMVTLGKVASLPLKDALRLMEIMKMVGLISEALNPDRLGIKRCFEQILQGALSLTNAKLGAIFRVIPGKGELRMVSEQGMGADSKRECSVIPFNTERGIVVDVVKTGKAIRTTGDNAHNVELWKRYKSFLDEGECKSFLCVPIKANNEVIGVIELESTDVEKFSHLSEQVIMGFASMAALALASEMDWKEWNIQKQNKTRVEFLKLVAHSLKDPLSSVRLRLHRCRTFAENENMTGLKELIAEAYTAADHANKAVDEALEATKYPVEIEYVDIHALIEVLAKDIRKEWPHYKVDSIGFVGGEVQDSVVTTLTDLRRLRLVFKELITNAAKEMNDGLMKIHCERSGEFVDILFEDDGPGIAPEMVESLFQPGETTRDSSGMGLSTSRFVIEILGGRLELKQTSRKGATFLLRLPDASYSSLGHLP